MTDARDRFHPSELDLELDQASAGLLATARDLEAYAQMSIAAPAAGFEDRVMAAIASEPLPRPIPGLGLIAMMRDSWAAAFGPGRPMAVRAQAFALLLVFAVAIGSVGTLVGVGASRLLAPSVPTPPVTPSPLPSPPPSPSIEPTFTPSPSATSSPTPTETASPTETADATRTDGSGSDRGPGGGGGGGSGSGSSGSGSSRGSGSGSIGSSSGRSGSG
jgi:uncharacterized membrane protein YgcG